MKQKNNIIFGIVVGTLIVSIGIGVGVQQYREHSTGAANSGLEERVLTVGSTVLRVEVARTEEQRRIGLSHRPALAEGRGMLFPFDTDKAHGIWMRDMQFPIDIIWIDTAMKVVHIAESIAPDTYPKIFTPPTPTRYVLEVPAGYTRGRITVGDTVVMQEK